MERKSFPPGGHTQQNSLNFLFSRQSSCGYSTFFSTLIKYSTYLNGYLTAITIDKDFKSFQQILRRAVFGLINFDKSDPSAEWTSIRIFSTLLNIFILSYRLVANSNFSRQVREILKSMGLGLRKLSRCEKNPFIRGIRDRWKKKKKSFQLSQTIFSDIMRSREKLFSKFPWELDTAENVLSVRYITLYVDHMIFPENSHEISRFRYDAFIERVQRETKTWKILE